MKTTIRKSILKQLKQAPQAQRKKLEKELYQLLFQSDFWQEAQTIAVTLSQKFELNTEPIIHQAWKEHKKVVVPRTEKARQMSFVQIQTFENLVMTPFGVLEPSQELAAYPKEHIQLIIVPGVGFKKTGERIGFGGGYYDRFLADYQGTTASLIFQEQLEENWLPETTDIPVQQLFIAKEKLATNS
ncbi:5-formyltetrahydrofolate cyclo-ligase [Isobaculum melis]|uniref:5-formyltetrahydrofolate cyclo-ligase n=1 Tax=Isobaculum melis TaxID=142588 RepID=A0A1H9RSQ6_9LACT|nr:5-formyltetrahydrofolate cyclo-ligase [Isobaculum melis]SER75822.1 5-formyltetrahydrofolate cyclo-ligase [Isobaculum melis]